MIYRACRVLSRHILMRQSAISSQFGPALIPDHRDCQQLRRSECDDDVVLVVVFFRKHVQDFLFQVGCECVERSGVAI